MLFKDCFKKFHNNYVLGITDIPSQLSSYWNGNVMESSLCCTVIGTQKLKYFSRPFD
jgi:hypothetical protein